MAIGPYNDANAENIAEVFANSGLSELRVISKAINYTAVAGDFVLVLTAASDLTITLPPIGSSLNVSIAVKLDEGSGAGNVIIDGDGAETINGNLTITIKKAGTAVWFHGGATEWEIK